MRSPARLSAAVSVAKLASSGIRKPHGLFIQAIYLNLYFIRKKDCILRIFYLCHKSQFFSELRWEAVSFLHVGSSSETPNNCEVISDDVLKKNNREGFEVWKLGYQHICFSVLQRSLC